MFDYDWNIYARDWLGYPPDKQGEILIKELHLYGDPVALAWWPEKTMPNRFVKYIYTGPLKLVHCQFMMRARFRLETYILDGVTSRPPPPVCNGDEYVGLAPLSLSGEHGAFNAITDPNSDAPAALRIYGSPTAARRSLTHDYTIVPPNIRYLGMAPLTDCPFDPDVVVLFGSPRQMLYASRALQWWSGITPKSLTGPGTCSSSWAAAYIHGEPRYTLGCFGVFSIMGMNPNHISLSIPSEMMPTLCNVLELWREKGRPLFYETPPDEAREHVRAPYDGVFTKGDEAKPCYIEWDIRLREPYENWADRRRKKGLYVPEEVL
jgi:uncharacterized protein (DUF169 family)